MIIAHVSEPPEPPINRVPGMSPALDALILRMLSKKPEHRPQTMDDVAAELAACAATMGMVLDKPLRPRLPVERPVTAAQFSSTQVSPGGIPRSQVTPLPGSGAIRAPSSPSLRPVTPYGVPAKPASVIESGRVRVPTGSGPDTSVPAAYVGGTRVMEAQVRPTTTMGSAAAEVQKAPVVARPAARGKMFALAGGAVLVVGVIAIVATRGGSPHKRSVVAEPTATAASVDNVAAPAPPAPSAAAEPPPAAAAPSAPALPDTVRIDLQGVPARTAVTLDGRPASLPLQIARGPQVHRIVLKPPSGAERTLEIDGSKDRLVELMFDKRASSTDSQSSHSSSSDSGHSSSGSSHGKSSSGKKKPGAGSDRDAITDI
jgi:serine/threonine-protein kinase